MTKLTVDEALAAIRAAPTRSEPVSVPLAEAKNRILFESVVAGRDQPPFDASAMDGYAVAATTQVSKTYKVVGESSAGRAFPGLVSEGEAIRIFTGAPLPAGTNRVILQEDVWRDGTTITLKEKPDLGSKPHVRPCASDFAMGDILLTSGDRLDGWKLALVAAGGASHVKVFKRPRVVIVCAGDELVGPGDIPRNDQIFETNSFALAALVEQWGGEVVPGRISQDNLTDLTRHMTLEEADIIVTVGGASVGDYDLVRPALTRACIAWGFQAINMKPGKPTAYGTLPNGQSVLCLPGNPGSALVSAHLFLKPLIKKALGEACNTPFRLLPCAAGLPANGPREAYLRALVLAGTKGGLTILPFSCQDSGNMRDFAITDGIIRRLANGAAINAGEMCECLLVNDNI
ncbi:gephyrin-like molybdotransferase Glp [Asticcacaulis sp. 201]|uniref:molybdopterin molybdotransferase MoeA n=1 Tax=Asticcacaulis sp. 201 TaxID=3028787 RepID=UPI002915CFC3|nr:gephyrin-like molybdotransferase Glp [Asticcacaulis sp. 201]MDV6331224.1 molybdopterin molybdotransferase MoeA [Asticcacaulis sp. 201]